MPLRPRNATPTTLEVTITPSDVERGCRGSAWACPAVRAIQRRFVGAPLVCVAASHVTIYTTAVGLRYWLPDDLMEAITAYDTHGTSPVGTYTLEYWPE